MKKIISLAILFALIATPVLAQKATLVSPQGKKVAVEVGAAKSYFGLGYKLQTGLRLGASTSSIPVTPPFGKLVGNNTWTGYNTFSSSSFSGFAQTNFISTYPTTATITPGNLVTFSTTTGQVILATASSTQPAGNDYSFFGVALSTTTASTSPSNVYVQSAGLVNIFAGLTAGTDYYVSNSAGTASATMGYFPILFGRAVSTTTILINRRVVVGTPFGISNGVQFTAQTDGTITGASWGGGSGGQCSIAVNGTTIVAAGTTVTASLGAACTASVKKGQYFVDTFQGNSSNAGFFTPIN